MSPKKAGYGPGDTPLALAQRITEQAKAAWQDGSLIQQVTPTTAELLRWWFDDAICELRGRNFHVGQRRSILNAVYVHEVLKCGSVFDAYAAAGNGLDMDPAFLDRDKYRHPKICLKMATGTGKTWVMHALLIWQYLNALTEDEVSNRFSRNFLLVAPGLIVYDRLLDAYLGRQLEDGTRDFAQSDFKRNEELFIPPVWRETLYGFLQNGVIVKDEIGRKPVGEGCVAIANWHLLSGTEETESADVDPLDDPSQAVKELFPIFPGTSQGQALDTLDRKYLSGGELEWLASRQGLVVINDEAHHLHEVKKGGLVLEVEWQKSLNVLAQAQGERFFQIDFSATPYETQGTGQKRTKHYFPHIISDFHLKEAIARGLVKIITLDKRKEFAAEGLDFKAVRDESGTVIGLSEGQRLMLRAGLRKLDILEDAFLSHTDDGHGHSDKRPKMLVICEDTSVSPHVEAFLRTEGMTESDILRVDSDRKGEIPTKDWDALKQKLFDVDSHEKPRVIVSVLMLREGFDVNNICVIVPLRSSQAPILLEQVIGRGLRLMWREPEYQEIKAESRERVLVKKQAPTNYLDILSIVEHPAFLEFYNDLEDIGELPDVGDPKDKEGVLSDLLRVGLKPDYKDYDLFWPMVVQDREEHLEAWEPSASELAAFKSYPLEKLRKMAGESGEEFFSQEMTVKTRFGDYKVSGEKLTAQNYNELLARIVGLVTTSLQKVSARKSREFPLLQVQSARLLGLVDDFIRFQLFGEVFNPLHEDNWKVLLLSQSGITQHILEQISKTVYRMQTKVIIEDAQVIRHWFSDVPELKLREAYSLPVAKCIYPRLPFPSNKGGLEKAFTIACDADSEVEAFIKIGEYQHTFARILYLRSDGMLANYSPDFLLRFDDAFYLVETKASAYLNDENVQRKQKGAFDWLRTLNELPEEMRNNREWKYALVGENAFYRLHEKGANIREILELNLLTQEMGTGRLI